MKFNVRLAVLLWPCYIVFFLAIEYVFGRFDVASSQSTAFIFLVAAVLLTFSIYYLVQVFRKRNREQPSHSRNHLSQYPPSSVALALLAAIFLSSSLVDLLALIPGADGTLGRVIIQSIGYAATCVLFVLISRWQSGRNADRTPTS